MGKQKNKLRSCFVIFLLVNLFSSVSGCTFTLMNERPLLDDVEKRQIQLSRPAWVDSPPEDDANFHYLVGLSNPFSSEKTARKDALSDARMNYAYYTGITVKQVSEVFSSLYAENLAIVNPNILSLSTDSGSVLVDVRRVKAKYWHLETTVNKRGSDATLTYQYWVLVEVPHEEYERVQRWKKNKIEQRAEAQRKIDVVIKLKQQNSQRYFEGDTLSYDVSLSQQAHMLMIYEDAAGNFIQIQPAANSNKNVFSSYEFKVTAPFGKETIYVYSSEQGFPSLKGAFGINGLYYLKSSEKGESIISFMNKYMASIKNKKMAWGIASANINTLPRFYTMN